MSSDLQALLAAIVANPSDDVARLAYADCMEEQGNAPRAQFIRLQIEAERHHPDSHTCAELEDQASELFERHWVEWWGEVCTAVGLRSPASNPRGRLERLANWVGFGTTPGTPYTRGVSGSHFGLCQTVFEPEEDNQGFGVATFRRGFPDSVLLDRPSARGHSDLLARWLTVSPLASLFARQPFAENWTAGPRPTGIRTLELIGPSAMTVLDILESLDASGIESLALHPFPLGPTPPSADDEATDAFAELLGAVLNSPRLHRLKSLSVQLASLSVSGVLAQAPRLAALTSLEIDLCRGTFRGVNRLATLMRSPFMSGLSELKVIGTLGPDEAHALTTGANRESLRRLTLGLFRDTGEYADSLDAVEFTLEFEDLLARATFPALEELRVAGEVVLDTEVLNALGRSPLMKQLKHFAIAVTRWDRLFQANLDRLPQIFDLNRIETFAFSPGSGRPDLSKLQRQLGDRLRVRE
jgi:uncharacterized protein (TIGR02996 family)